MPDRLFLKSIAAQGGTLTLELAVGDTVVLDEMTKRRDLPDGLTEHAATVSRDDERFDVRTVCDVDGRITRVIASASDIPDDWYETPEEPEE